MKYYKKITGEKVYLSPISADDTETFLKWLNDEEVAVNLTAMPDLFSLSNEKGFVEELAKNNNTFSIIDAQTDKLIGNCGFVNERQVHRTAEIGIIIGEKDYWSKGYGSEALKLLLDFGFKVRNYNNIALYVHSYNKRAIACYEKAGFKKQGVKREALMFGDRKFDLIYMDILSPEHKTDYLSKYFD